MPILGRGPMDGSDAFTQMEAAQLPPEAPCLSGRNLSGPGTAFLKVCPPWAYLRGEQVPKGRLNTETDVYS